MEHSLESPSFFGMPLCHFGTRDHHSCSKGQFIRLAVSCYRLSSWGSRLEVHVNDNAPCFAVGDRLSHRGVRGMAAASVHRSASTRCFP